MRDATAEVWVRADIEPIALPARSATNTSCGSDARTAIVERLPLGSSRCAAARPDQNGLTLAAVLLLAAVDGLATFWLGARLLPALARHVAERSLADGMVVALAPILAIALFAAHGLYNTATILRRSKRLGTLVTAWVETAMVMILAITTVRVMVDGGVVVLNAATLSQALALCIVGGAAPVVCRLLWHTALLEWLLRATPPCNAIVLGATPMAARVIETLRQNDQERINVVGVLADQTGMVHRSFCGLPILGPLARVADCVRDCHADLVLLPSNDIEPAQLEPVMARAATTSVDLRLVTEREPRSGFQTTLPLAGNLLTTPLQVHAITGWAVLLKRAEDVVLSGLAIFLLTPLLVAIAIAIKLDSPGSVLFRQKRYGYNGNLFSLLKFRTMHGPLSDRHAMRQASRGDPRVTRVGAFLRRHSLDELPQLFNVLAGDMSLVGPRPHAVGTNIGGLPLCRLASRYDARHRVKPGITGWAQINRCRGELDSRAKLARRVEYDLHYIEHWSLRLDLRILLSTIGLAWHDQDAY